MFWGGGESEKSRSDLRYRYIRGWWDERKRGGGEGKAGKNQVPAMDPRPRTFGEKQKPLLSIYLFVLSHVVCMPYTLVFFAWEDRELNAGVCVRVWRASLAGGQSVSEAEYRWRSPVVWGKCWRPSTSVSFSVLYTPCFMYVVQWWVLGTCVCMREVLWACARTPANDLHWIGANRRAFFPCNLYTRWAGAERGSVGRSVSGATAVSFSTNPYEQGRFPLSTPHGKMGHLSDFSVPNSKKNTHAPQPLQMKMWSRASPKQGLVDFFLLPNRVGIEEMTRTGSYHGPGGETGWWNRVVKPGGETGWWNRVVKPGGETGWWMIIQAAVEHCTLVIPVHESLNWETAVNLFASRALSWCRDKKKCPVTLPHFKQLNFCTQKAQWHSWKWPRRLTGFLKNPNPTQLNHPETEKLPWEKSSLSNRDTFWFKLEKFLNFLWFTMSASNTFRTYSCLMSHVEAFGKKGWSNQIYISPWQNNRKGRESGSCARPRVAYR